MSNSHGVTKISFRKKNYIVGPAKRFSFETDKSVYVRGEVVVESQIKNTKKYAVLWFWKIYNIVTRFCTALFVGIWFKRPCLFIPIVTTNQELTSRLNSFLLFYRYKTVCFRDFDLFSRQNVSFGKIKFYFIFKHILL